MLPSVLVSKAVQVFSALTVEQRKKYETVKELILKAYELVAEAYRHKFREANQRDDQTHVEFAREKEHLFDK